MVPGLSFGWFALRKRVLASLIVCVALLTQFGASLWGAAAARDGLVVCHTSIASSDTLGPTRIDQVDRGAPAQTPVGHDHASCSLCQLGFTFFRSETPVFEARVLAHARIRLSEPEIPAPTPVLTYSAPARAPPSQA